MILACLGDSLTYGYGVGINNSWLSIIKDSLNINILNKGINGDTTASMLERCYEDVILKKPTIVTIMGGTNDFFVGLDNNYVAENIKLLTKELMFKNITPIILSPPPVIPKMATASWSPYTDFEIVNNQLQDLDAELKKYCAENNITFISLYALFMSMDLEDTSLYIDGVHPTAKGHQLIADKLLNLDMLKHK